MFWLVGLRSFGNILARFCFYFCIYMLRSLRELLSVDLDSFVVSWVKFWRELPRLCLEGSGLGSVEFKLAELPAGGSWNGMLVGGLGDIE